MHLTDDQLNEYLDKETNDRTRIELHLSTCADCMARLDTLQDLFSEIESLPDVELSPRFASHVTSHLNPAPQIPRSLGLTIILQAMLVVIVFVVAAPFVMPFLSPYISGIPAPSFVDLLMQLQSQWDAWLEVLSTFQIPAIPELALLDFSSMVMLFAVMGVSLLWLIGNGLLLRNHTK